MKIAHVCPFYKPTICGVGQVVYELAQRQLEEGHEVHIYTSDWDKNERIKEKEALIEGIYVHRNYYWFKIANFVSFWPSVFFKLLKQDFDVVHNHVTGHPHVFFSSLAGKIKKSRVIHTTHCPWTKGFRKKIYDLLLPIYYYIMNNISYSLIDKIIAITPWEINFIKKYADKSKINVIPNGMSDFLYKRIRNNDIRKRLGISNRDKLVLFFGRLNATKGVDKLVEVAKEITKERKDIYFVFRGPDEGMRYVVEDAVKKNKNIILVKETRDKEEIAKTYQSADVYVLPSYREGLPLSLFEAFASGLPVVASPVNGIPYEMKEPENGFLVKYGDLRNLKRRILQILDDKKLAERISKNNKIKAKNYNWDLIYRKTMSLYNS